MKKNILISILLIVLVGSIGFSFGMSKNTNNVGGDFRTSPTFYSASSTAFTLTTASQKLLGTSTPTRRVAALIQTTACARDVFLKMDSDNAATANTGVVINATTTQIVLSDYSNIPVVQGSVQGILGAGTCTVLVTEWRSQY